MPAQRIWKLKHTQSKRAAVETVNPPIIKNIVHGEGEFCKQNMWLKDGCNGVKGNGNKAAGGSAAWKEEQRGGERFKESGIG